MKKLKLTAFQLGSTEILTRQQLRNVLGGDVGNSTTSTTTQMHSLDCSIYPPCANSGTSCGPRGTPATCQCWDDGQYWPCSTGGGS
jgi:hypothetical protein